MVEHTKDDVDDDANDPLLAAVARIPPRPLERREPTQWQPPGELDEYRLIQPLGRGGMGSVWLAEDRLLDRLVAIKFIAHDEPNKQTRERFAIEARAAARLAHVNVVTVHRYGEIAGRPYLVSEYIRGEPLDKLAKPIPWERAHEIGIALARGLAAAHRHGIVHRDIKPANAILTADGDAKLVDFGLAKLDHHESADMRASSLAIGAAMVTQAGAIAGTPRYLAPEVREGEPASRRSDVYQIGAILYELVVGRAPLVDMLAWQAETASQDTPRSTEVGDQVPSLVDKLGSSSGTGGDGSLTRARIRFATVVDRCLKRDPEDRFAAGDELREALEQILATSRAIGELPAGNPYRGLVPFEAEHRALFFGRDGDVRAVLDRLRSESFVLVTGDSGVGKSSLARAGVVPRVLDGAFGDGKSWRVVSMVPGARPLSTLATLIAGELELDEAELAATMRDEPNRLGRELRRALGRETELLVMVDQLEEVSTLADRREAEDFAAVLAELVSGTPGLRLLATVRSDFLTRVAELPAIGGDIARAIYLLRPLSAKGAREAVVGPAKATGVRFESDALVETLVGSVVELPLLAFTLAQLWDARDLSTETITAGSLDAIGGVKGALARHADAVIDGLLPEQRAAARRLLLRLVTPERTRARRSATELGAIDLTALDALVRGRLVVARVADEPRYELAHERLIDGWRTLASWIAESAEAIVVHNRLAAAVTEWDRIGRAKDVLWNARRLADLAVVAPESLTRNEAAFVTASRRAVRRRRVIVGGIAVIVPAAVLSLYVGMKLVARQDLDRKIDGKVAEARSLLVAAHDAEAASVKLRSAAFALFDAGEAARGETDWEAGLERSAVARARYAEAVTALEAAFFLDTTRGELREQLGQVTLERIELAEREHRDGERAELETRLALYDPQRAAGLTPSRLTIDVQPTGSTVSILKPNGVPVEGLPDTLERGSYVIEAKARDRATVRLPIVLRGGEQRKVALALPRLTDVPEGFVYVPAGTFLYGSKDENAVRAFFGTTPMHEVETRAFLIGRTEVTYREWIDFLEDLEPGERERHRPYVEAAASLQAGALSLHRLNGGIWELLITPSTIAYTARAGAQIEYPGRDRRKRQDWLQLPVSGISAEDVLAYTAWLHRTGRVPRARLCTEYEWERAARGADGRAYPHGDRLSPEDANIDVTYGRVEGSFGPDAVGSYPASTSPYGLVDTTGNVFEVVRSSVGAGYVGRGGCYFQGARVAHLANRHYLPQTTRHAQVGVRICADAP
ncbi:MAG TPA: SUMF1/EgtB/PvdO family nonheme iron enzyme [Kofleriaceae bacterium]